MNLAKRKLVARKGFTLIELMIVIAIIGIMAVISIESFEASLRYAKFDIATDMLVSTLKQQQSGAKNGKIDYTNVANNYDSKQAKCYGVIINRSNEVGKQVQLYSSNYVAVGTVKADYCDDVQQENIMPFTDNQDFKIIGFEQNGQENSGTKLDINFKPPLANANVMLSSLFNVVHAEGLSEAKINDKNIKSISDTKNSDVLKDVIVSGSSNNVYKIVITSLDGTDKKNIVIDKNSGLIYKENILNEK